MRPSWDPEVQVSAPAKLILLGEWAVLAGHPALATALSPRFTLSYAPQRSPSLDFESRGEGQLSWPLGQSLPEGFFSLAARAWKEVASPLQGARFFFERAWRLDEGLGSSSALLSCLCALKNRLQGHRPKPLELWQEARALLRHLQKGLGSGLDLAAQILGGTVLQRGDALSAVELGRPAELFLVHTGSKVDTAQELKRRAPDPGILKALGESVESFLSHRHWPEAIREHARLLQNLGVEPDFVGAARRDWEKHFGVRALKTTGAGGGDGLLVWVEKQVQAPWREAVSARSWWVDESRWNERGLDVG